MMALAAAGCGGQEAAETPAGSPAPSAVAPATPAAQTAAFNPDEVLVDVDGMRITAAEVETQLAYRLRGMRDRIPPAQLQGVRARMRNSIVEDFIVRSLLLAEAARRAIPVTERDEQEAFDKIRADLPEGTTLEEVMARSPMGEARMREEVRVGIRIEKLLEKEEGDTLEVSDEDVNAFYEENKDRLTLPENVQARHLLVAVSTDDDQTARAAKREKAEQLRQQLVDGADFAGLAADHSDCPSRQKGGVLGTFRRGQMVKPFEEAAFSQEVGEIGPVIETRFGYHVIEVTEHNEQGQVPRDDVIAEIKTARRRELIGRLAGSLKDSATITYGPSVRPTGRGNP